jgi:hypothetical protein
VEECSICFGEGALVISAIQDKGGGAHIFPRAKNSRRAQAQASRHIFQEGAQVIIQQAQVLRDSFTSLRRSLDCIRFLVYLLVVAFALRSPYIYLSLLLVFPMGVFPGSC